MNFSQTNAATAGRVIFSADGAQRKKRFIQKERSRGCAWRVFNPAGMSCL